MGNSFESWEIISKMLVKVMGIIGFFREKFVDTLACRALNQPSTHAVEKSFTHLLTTKVQRINITINKTDCPLQEKCLSENTLHQADISSENFQIRIYYIISETKFKTRYWNHKKFFNYEKHKNDTRLSNELWKIKASKKEPVLVWKILGQHQPYNVNTKRCLLCLHEKLQIAIYRGNNMLIAN